MNKTKDKTRILVCSGTGCLSTESGGVLARFIEIIKERSLEGEVEAVKVGCMGFCEQGPIVNVLRSAPLGEEGAEEPLPHGVKRMVMPSTAAEDVFYVKVAAEDADEIIESHILKGEIVERLLYENPNTKERVAYHMDIPFYKSQKRIALKNCGAIDPENIDEAIAVSGYEALRKALFEMTPEDVVRTVKESGLRGRGGAGFSTGLKWEFAAKSASDKKYVICNADEGDPGAFMDRAIIEGDPHGVLEAMAICGYAIGADEGIVYIRAEYPLAVERLRIALEQAEARGFLGENILGSGFSFHVDMNLGAGAFVCGEETALMQSASGERGEPNVKPPYPAVKGLWGKPTNINNVETFANIPQIILRGGAWFREIGTPGSPGTKVFALAGKINNVGLVEVPMGISLRKIIEEIGGGIPEGKKFKAVQTGGPSGGVISEKDLDLPVDFDTLAAAGSMMGSGGLIVVDEDDCMVNFARFYLEFTVEESCGKCTPCRVGNTRLLEILERITEGEGTMEDLKNLEYFSRVIKDSSLCALGQTAPNPVLSTLRDFRDEYEAHVLEKRCPAGACQALKSYVIIPELCNGCTICARNCPVSCIRGKVKEVHEIEQENCIKCGVCMDKCPKKAIILK